MYKHWFITHPKIPFSTVDKLFIPDLSKPQFISTNSLSELFADHYTAALGADYFFDSVSPSGLVVVPTI